MKIIQNPWLRRGWYAEGVSTICGHIRTIRSPLFLRLGGGKRGDVGRMCLGENRGWRNRMFGTVDGKKMVWREDSVCSANQAEKVAFLRNPKQRKLPEKVPKMRGTACREACSQTREKSGFLEEKCALLKFPDIGKISTQFRIRQVDMQKRKVPFILCTLNLKIAQISCTIQNRICMIRERKSNHENVFQTGQKGKMPIARTYSTVIL